MNTATPKNTIIVRKKVRPVCYHCGAECFTDITLDDKNFCCDGCKLVYQILDSNGLCNYYDLQSHPGLSQIKPIRKDKFSYLDNEDIAANLYQFRDGQRAIVTFYIPAIHCSSCMWLLEHLPRLSQGIIESRLNFSKKEVTVQFLYSEITIRQLAELLSTIGYEPYISLNNKEQKQISSFNRQRTYKLGIAGFCFGNIMMLSFPEYLGRNLGIEAQYAHLFRYVSLLLSLPVFFYSASEFYISAWKGLRQRMLNIDAPIVLALIITYSRSIYEIVTATGSGYLDSMSGIVFFMLVGRVVQDQTYKALSFDRDYKSYFPIAVTVVGEHGNESKSLENLKEKDVVELHNNDIIPADSILIKGEANIDYSFVTGESAPVAVQTGEQLYAGGRQTGSNILVQIIKPVAGSYLTSLWNHYAFSKNKTRQNEDKSFIHVLSKYFTIVLFILAGATAAYWYFTDFSKIIPAVSAMLIVACPCALLLAATYTNGNLLRLFSNNGLFLRDASVIEQLGNINKIVFDKTGTITLSSNKISFFGHDLSEEEKVYLYNVVVGSHHPYSKALAAYLGKRQSLTMERWKEVTGSGIEAIVEGKNIRVGSSAFVGIDQKDAQDEPHIYVRIDTKITAFYFLPEFRESTNKVINSLEKNYSLALLSGDNDTQRVMLQTLFGKQSDLLFRQKPGDKLKYIERLQKQGNKVLMIGDGLNDAGALQQSEVGISLSEDVNSFSPACDAILDAKKFGKVPAMLRLAKTGKTIIGISFAISLIYNIVGLSISIRGTMNPMIAAILMPVSTISIVLITTGVTTLAAKLLGLKLSANK